MTEYISIKEANKDGETATLRGWIHRERGSKKLKFITLRDSTGIIQCVFEKDVVGDKMFDIITKIQVEASITVTGKIKKDDRAPGGFEIAVTDFTVVGTSDTFPITKDQSPEFLLDNRHLWLRSRKMQAILKIRNTVFQAIHDYYQSNGFFEFQSPIFQSTQCEGGSDLFEIKYFDTTTYLAQTWQLYAEAGIFSLEKMYTISPCFRAEKSKTSRHLTEYWHAEAEMAWYDFNDMIGVGEGVIKHIVKSVLEKNKDELEILKRDISRLQPIVEKPFPRMTYDEAIKKLKDECKIDLEWGKDLRTIEEDKLSSLFDTPIVVTHYPKKVKAFYMQEDPNNPDVVLGCDFIAPEGYGELIGGSQREADIESIKRRLTEMQEDPKNYEYYLDLRRYGSVPHSGFGMGVERVITWVCGLDNIKDSIAFPRTMLRCKP